MDNKEKLILEQGKVCVDSANILSKRRDTTNNIFYTLNTALITLCILQGNCRMLFISIASIAICIVGILLVYYYRNLNSAKFDIILKLEKELPHQVFKNEGNVFKKRKAPFEATILERFIPVFFIVIYIIFSILILSNCVN